MKAFAYCAPTHVIFGQNAEKQTAQAIKNYGGRRILLVYGGGSVVRSGLLERLCRQIESEGLVCGAFGGAQPNPTVGHVRQGIEKARSLQADFILGVGGGSSLDTAKAIAHGLANLDTDVWQYWSKEKVLEKTTPLGAVLTIPAAGSETSDSAVLTDELTGRKCGLTSQLNRPLFAIMDPSLAATLPAYQIGCGVADIMMHTLDRYFAPDPENGITDAIAEALLRTVVQYGLQALRDPADYKAMSEIMWCGSLSHNGLTGLGNTTDFATHQLGHALSAKYGAAHGASLTAVWGSWARYVCKKDLGRFAKYGRAVWGLEGGQEELAQAAICATERYFRQLGMPVSLAQLRGGPVGADDIDDLALRCSYGRSRTIGSFMKLDFDDMKSIYTMANG